MKTEKYKLLKAQIAEFVKYTADEVSLMANVTSVIHNGLGFFWTGFYRVKGDNLVLGPFQGTPACLEIAFGKGVCGAAWEKEETIAVRDVEDFPGHIACSSLSRSEIVVPLYYKGKVSAVLDIDSTEPGTFDDDDKIGLEEIAELLRDRIAPLSNEYEKFETLLKSDRSIRIFNENVRVDEDCIAKLVNLTRFCASGRNAQPLRYIGITSKEECGKLFPLLKWAGYFKNWDGPAEGERPAAYLVQCLDTDFGKDCLCDDGLQLQSITLGASAMGLGCCIIKSFDAVLLKEIFNLPVNIEPRYVVAIGKPAEEVRIIDTDGTKTADIKYFREKGIHYVPKRPLKELLL